MPIRFDPSPRTHLGVQFLKIPPLQTIRFIAPPDDGVRVWLHWHNGRSVPCRGEECLHCPSEASRYAYAGVLAGTWSGERFIPERQAIICLTLNVWELAENDQRDKIFQMTRVPLEKNGVLAYRELARVQAATFKPINVMDRLLARWKHLEEQDKKESQAFRARLFEGTDEKMA